MAQRSLLEIVDHRPVAPGHWELVLPKTESLAKAAPGQFVMLSARGPSSYDPLLRRPISIYRVEESSWSVLYRVVGRGTAALATLKPGDVVDCFGPLGRGYVFHDLEEGAPVALVGGGIGAPPLFFLSQRLKEAGIIPEVFVGFATSAHVVAVADWETMGVAVRVSTDDGSRGRRGFVTELLAERLTRGRIRRIFACGPRPMLKAVARMARDEEIECQIAMEEWMACGIGVCLSCVVRVRAGSGEAWARVCREGPVFDGREVVWPDA